MWREKRRGERSLVCSCHPGLIFLNFYLLPGLSYKKHSTSHMVQETRRKILRRTEKKEKKKERKIKRLIIPGNGTINTGGEWIVSLSGALFQLPDYLMELSKGFIIIISVRKSTEFQTNHTQSFKLTNPKSHCWYRARIFKKIQILSVYHLKFTTTMEENVRMIFVQV